MVLVSGPRWSSKTISVVHKVIRHLWETPNARVALFSKTIKNAKDGGVWDDIISFGLPEWLDAGLTGKDDSIVFEYVVPPKADFITRTLYFKIRNYWGGESELKLFSLDHDWEVEAKVKGQRFSMFWFSELTNFNDRNVLTATKQQLRMPHLRLDQHQWIADTNPSDDGEDHWIYDLWYRDRIRENHPHPDFQKQLRLIEIFLSDNPFLSPEKLAEIKGDFAYDKDLYARYVEGKWVGGGTKNRLFADLFKSEIHVAGSTADADEKEWSLLLPTEQCFGLITGFDLGDANHSAHILEKIEHGGKTYWNVLDELVVTGGEMSLEQFTKLFLEKMDAIEANIPAGRKVWWRHYSDESCNRYRSAVDDYDRNIVLRASGGRIDLEGVPKPSGSVEARKTILRRLLHEQRILISANCEATRAMLKRARGGKHKGEVILGDKHKHPFDSLMYPILMESAYDVMQFQSEIAATGKRANPAEIRL
jgi:hypothetical protein